MKVWRAAWLGVIGVWFLQAPAPGWSTEAVLIQRIGEPSGAAAEAVAEELTVVPLSPRIDPRTTPILLAAGKAYVIPGHRGRKGVGGLTHAERRALRLAYHFGQTIAVLDGSTHDVEALHTLLRDGAAHKSRTHPGLLAYTLRRENDIPTARVVTPVRTSLTEEDPEASELAWRRAIEIVIDELTHPPLVVGEEEPSGSSDDWMDSPVQQTTLTSVTNGIWNTPVQVFALHSCEADGASGIFYDYYLVNTGGDWTATDAQFESATDASGQIQPDGNGLSVDWQPGRANCTHAGPGSQEQRICRYLHYPAFYEISIKPPTGPNVNQVNAAPQATQGVSADYSSGFSFSLGGDVDVSGDGPSAGIQAGISWSQSVSTTVPPLLVKAGDTGNEGAFTQYEYCTVGSNAQDCDPFLQASGQSGLCTGFEVGDPQNGQTPDGRLSNVAQSVNWQVDPATYSGSTFDIEVIFTAELVTSEVALWWGNFCTDYFADGSCARSVPATAGDCDIIGCGCTVGIIPEFPILIDHVFEVPFPARQCPASAPSAMTTGTREQR